MKNGGEVVERLDNWDDAKRSYTYSILSGPLPVSDYRSTLSVAPDGKGSALHWHSTYQAKGTSDAEAKKLIDGIYEDSAKNLLGGCFVCFGPAGRGKVRPALTSHLPTLGRGP